MTTSKMTTCSSSLRAICLGLALLSARASADRRPQPRPQPPALATLESLPLLSGSLSHHGVKSGDNEYDRGQEYMLAMPQGTQPSPAAATFETDSYTDTAETTEGEGEDADRGSWKGVSGSSSISGDIKKATSEYAGTRHRAGADVREYLRHGLPVVTKTSELGHMYDVDAQAVLREILEQHKPIVSQTYDVDSDAVLAKYLEQQKPIVSQTYDLDSDSAFRKSFFEQHKPIVGQTYDLDSDSAFRKSYFEQHKPIVSEVDSDLAFKQYFEQHKPIFSRTYDDLDSDYASRKSYFEQQKPIISQTYELDSDSAFRKYFEQREPILTEVTEDLPNPIARNSYSIKPFYNVLPAAAFKEYTEVEAAPVVRKSVTILPPPIVQKLFKVMPAPVIRKYITAPPVVQSVRASPPVFNKFVKNIFVQHPVHPVQRQQPIVIVTPPSKNVYNLIKLAAPTPSPTTPVLTSHVPIPVPTTPVPTTPEPTTPEATTPVPTTPMPTTPEAMTAAPISTPPPPEVEALVRQTDEVEEEATEEQKLKSIGKMVVVETVRRVVDVPEFDGPAPPPARSEETIVEPDGTVRKFEKYIEYDQVSSNQQAAGVRASHSKKQSKSSYAVQAGPVHVDAATARASTAASPATARLLHTSTFFPGTFATQGSPAFLSRPDGSSFDSMTRTQFAKALMQPTHEGDTAASASSTPERMADGRMQKVDMEAESLERHAEHLELPSGTVAHFTTEVPAQPKETPTMLSFAATGI